MANNNWDSFSDDDFEDVILDLDDDPEDIGDVLSEADDLAEDTAAKASDSWSTLAAAAQRAANRTSRPVRKIERTAGEDDMPAPASERPVRRSAAARPSSARSASDRPSARPKAVREDDFDEEEERPVRRTARTPQRQTQRNEAPNRLKSYIMIAIVCLLVVALIVLALKLLLKKNPSDSNKTSTPDSTAEAPVETTAAWAQNSPSDVLSLVNQYYGARIMCSFDELAKILDPVVSIDQAKVEAESKVIEGFQQVCVYTTPGIKTGEYGVCITYDMKLKNITTPAPGMVWGYVRPDSEGNLRLIDKETFDLKIKQEDPEFIEINNFLVKAQDCDAMKQVNEKVVADYKQAMAMDATLESFVNSLKPTSAAPDETPADTTTAEPTTAEPTSPAPDEEFTPTDTMKYTQKRVKCRIQPNTEEGTTYTIVDAGTRVQVVGIGEKWCKVCLPNGSYGYIMKEYLGESKP